MSIHSVATASEWESLASATFVPVRVESTLPAFRGSMEHHGCGDGGVTVVRSGSGRVFRTADLIESSPEDLALFSVQVKGTSRVEQDGRQGRVSPGNGVLYLTRSAYQLSFPEPTELAILQVPSERLGLRRDALGSLVARPLPLRRDPALRTMTRVLRSLFSSRPVLADAAQALDVATELLAAALRPDRRRSGRRRNHAELYAAFERIIHERLDDPQLDVAGLAEQEGVSIRTVHNAFAEFGTTPAAHLRAARLDRGRRLLSTTRLPLSDVAVLCGNEDASVFTRSFRREWGLTPSEYRRQSQARQGSRSGE